MTNYVPYMVPTKINFIKTKYLITPIRDDLVHSNIECSVSEHKSIIDVEYWTYRIATENR